MPLYLLSAWDPPKAVITKIERALANFFWGQKDDKRKFHWCSWSAICLPIIEEGGLGIRSSSDVCITFSMKLWFNIQKGLSLWARFMFGKYCKTRHPIISQPGSYSPMWRRLAPCHMLAESFLFWIVGKGHVSLWYDNWCDLDPLYLLMDEIPSQCSDWRVEDFFVLIK
ncbi:Ribonuclease H protein [Quillaja saponaria]|uniref:Ribonuclease H protein n=1 Tax=Quillaja saponaria TaxID=32244 RepID=A0AAD7VDC9_QUISA|nr:Ribonuclease H protein [Quillaja saponaria]